MKREQIIKAIIDSLGMSEDTKGHGYKLHIYKGEWWISHNVVGSGEPVSQWLEREIDKVEVAEIKGTPMPSGWICPRCQKVHSWMVQSCDCSPNVITASTTELIKELANPFICPSCESDNCHFTTIIMNRCNDCGVEWEPKTE